MRHNRPLLVKGGMTGEKWPVNLACDSDIHVNRWVLLHAANLRQDRRVYLPSEGRRAVDYSVLHTNKPFRLPRPSVVALASRRSLGTCY
jgi:hypothetical protein